MDLSAECVVIGGGAAGLSAALVLGRARRRVVVVDAGRQSNLPAHGIGGLLGHDRRPPAELYARAREELATYPTVQVVTADIASVEATTDGFVVHGAAGFDARGRSLLLAPGMTYRLPEVPGIEALWGRTVFHCPFCHGWEARGGRLGVLDPGPMAAQRALLLRAWSEDVTLFTGGSGTADLDRVRSAGVTVVDEPVVGLEAVGDQLREVVLADGTTRPLDGLLVGVTLHQRSPLVADLGVAVHPPGLLAHDAVVTDAMGPRASAASGRRVTSARPPPRSPGPSPRARWRPGAWSTPSWPDRWATEG